MRRDFNMLEGHHCPSDLVTLYDLALRSKDSIVEIGSWAGKSTCALANGSNDGNGAYVYAIDHFRGSEVHIRLGRWNLNNLYGRFLNNIKEQGFEDTVRCIPIDVDIVDIRWIRTPIGLLFIDGDHRMECVKRDFEKFKDYVAYDGVVLFHDYATGEPGVDVTEFVDGLITSGEWRMVYPHTGMMIGIGRK